MAQVYNENNMPRKAERLAEDPEASKCNDFVPTPSNNERDQESKNSDESSHHESNVIRVSASGLHSDEDNSDDVGMSARDQEESDHISQRGNEHKTNEAELFQNDPNNNLRRSERNAKMNSQSSYGIFGRRPAKYDDFEYGTNIGQKGNVEMNPPGSVGSNKRRRKTSQMTVAPFPEGGMKRSMSAKTPSNHATLTSTENNGASFNQGRWT